jgi:hypothetical protein
MRRLPSTDDREAHDSRSRIVRACADLADSTAFNLYIFAVIVANAVVLGLETYDSVARSYGDLLGTLNNVFLGVFLVELAIRLTAFGSTPSQFFRSGWNVFDFVVILASFAPGLRENTTLLRLAAPGPRPADRAPAARPARADDRDRAQHPGRREPVGARCSSCSSTAWSAGRSSTSTRRSSTGRSGRRC